MNEPDRLRSARALAAASRRHPARRADCPVCGDVVGPSHMHDRASDPAGAAIMSAHRDGDHRYCHPDGCEESER